MQELDGDPAQYSDIDLETIHDQANSEINRAEYTQTGKGLFSKARIDHDGRIIVSLNLNKELPDLPPDYAPEVHEFGIDALKWMEYPPMSIVIMIVGSPGDVQPYVALGKRLLQDGHRIRIASHATFRSFVFDAGLELFNIGENPQELMSYMVKNPGLIPGFESLTNGDIGKKRKMLSDMLLGCWRSCHCPDIETSRPFVADAIISNPPAFAHIHCAEAMGILLLLSFTMPWSPTTAFPHPLVKIQSSNAKTGLTNYLSYALADIITWQGIGDIVNKFRKRSPGLPGLSLKAGAGVLDNLKVPWTYCMSSGLVPKPKDWMSHFVLPLPQTLYLKQLAKLVSEHLFLLDGKGGLGGVSIPPHIFILGNIPHDWLFANGRVCAVVHHGGAGTTAIGLSKGLPTVVVPFFGDQGFWGNMIHKAGAGPEPIPHKLLGVDNLRDAIWFAISPGAKAAARKLAEEIQKENMRCDLDSSKVAVWWSTKHCLKFSAFAAQTLIDARLFEPKRLDLHYPKNTKRTSHLETQLQVQQAHSPVKGIVHTTTAIPKGMMKIIISIHQGLHNMPKLYGSDVRRPGKGLLYGCYDGITGLVREPWQCAQQDGLPRAVKGAGRGPVRPAASALGLVANPMEGARKSTQCGIMRKEDQPHYRTRVEEGFRAVEHSTENDRAEIMRRFKILMQKDAVAKGKKTMAKIAQEIMYGSMMDNKMERGRPVETAGASSSTSPSSMSPPSYTDLMKSEKETSQ
ncbi:glycosyltransferase family 1 protein [Lentinula aciculospora]|uniref:Glycosyltransferase family 1 protein n=1 Tax=Lentinula aciculospora TaxID=153920 RepID=A0A9W9DQF9_9AGAR|nr:glycosyltransferase family 1 protein [Lentinula aciculospora]